MSSEIPDCAVLTAAGTTLQDYLTALYTRHAAVPGVWTIENVVGGGTPTSWTQTHPDGYQINYRASGGQLLIGLAPLGGVSNSATPGTPSGWQESVGLIAPSGTNAECLFADYDDTIFFGWKSTAKTAMAGAFLIGRQIITTQAQRAAGGGFAILGGVPTVGSSSTANIWFSSGTPRHGRLKLDATKWANGLVHSGEPASRTQGTGDYRFDEVAFQGHPDGSSAPNTNASPILGLSKYLSWACGPADSQSPFVLNESAGSNQAQMSLSSSASPTRLRIRWNKTVDPTP